MSTSAPRTRPRSAATARGLVAGVALMVLAMVVPAATGWNVRVNSFPPLHAEWAPRLGPGTLPAVLVALLGGWQAVDAAARLRWRWLLVASYGAGLAWMLALAFVDGSDGIGQVLDGDYEYLDTARAVDDLPATLREFVGRIGYDARPGTAPADLEDASPRNWPVHVAGHPPGALAFFVVLVRLGLGSGFAAGLVVTLLAASTAVAVLVTLRALGAGDAARRAAPFLVFGPAAVWQAVSADAMFAAVAAWGLATLAVAATRGSIGLSVVAGLLLGSCVLLSYGLPLLGVLAVAVLVLAGTSYPFGFAAAAALVPVGVFWAYGFSYADALPAIRERYFEGVGGRRPTAYWVWAGPAALLFSAGPLLGAGVGQTAARGWGRWRELWADRAGRVVPVLAGAAALSVLIADASLMSKAEVERIWLPFVPWLLITCALLPERWRRRGLLLQLGFALAVQHLLATGW